MNRAAGRQIGGVRGLFLFALLSAFALLSVVTVIVGARVYTGISGRVTQNYDVRTVLTYLVNKTRSADMSDAVRVETHGGQDVLVLRGVYGGEAYNTYIYLSDGAIREYFGAEARGFEAALGERIAGAETFSARIEGGRLHLGVGGTDGRMHVTEVCLQSAMEERG